VKLVRSFLGRVPARYPVLLLRSLHLDRIGEYAETPRGQFRRLLVQGVSTVSHCSYVKTGPKVLLQKRSERAESLAKVLEQSEHVKELVEECAEELASANSGIKQEFGRLHLLPRVESAIGKSEAVVEKVQEASEKLAVVNDALEGQVRERNMLDHQLAAAVEQEESARHAALHDVLTDLPNRALFYDRLEHGLAQAKRHGRTLAVMFLDLDDFKRINDSHGHDVGDCVLQTIAQRLKENTRVDDTVSRYGGDEFLYVLMEIRDNEHLALIAEKIIEMVQAPCDIAVHDVNICPSIKASIGIAIFPQDGTTADMLVKNADRAMYRAKQNKSGYSFAE
jgi:diguanylate cyclase